MGPRSSATTFNPALVSSAERIPPVQPSPTTTASTSGSLVAMVASSSAQVRNALGVCDVLAVAEFRDVLAMYRDDAGKAHQLPARLVAVAAVDRVGEHAFHDVLIELAEERARGQPVRKGDLAVAHP